MLNTGHMLQDSRVHISWYVEQPVV